MDNMTIIDTCAVGNWTITPPEDHLELDRMNMQFKIGMAMVYAVICFFGTIGNSISLAVLFSNKSLHTLPNIYIGHMAIVDLITCITIIPSAVVQHLTGKEIPSILCQIMGYMILLNFAAATCTMALIAINRYILIIKGKKLYNKLYSKKTVALTLVIIWIWNIAIVVVPSLAGFGEFGHNAKLGLCLVKSYCLRTYLHMLTMLSLAIYLPSLLSIGYCYFRIIYLLLKIRRRMKAYKENKLATNSDKKIPELKELSSHSDEKSEITKVETACGNSEKVYMATIAQENIADDPSCKVESLSEHPYAAMHASSTPKLQRPQLYRSLSNKRGSESTSEIYFENGETTIRRRSNTFLQKIKEPRWRKQYLAILNMLTIFVMLFVCWAPVIVLYAVDMYGRVPALIYKICVVFIYFNSAFNVLFYGVMNKTFRKAHKELWDRCIKKTRSANK